jgi:hypothetical protein
MYENPEITRQLVNDRLDESRGLAAERRLAGATRRRDRRRNRWSSRFATSTPIGRSPAQKPAPA